jgi:hypothetical protein
MTTPDTPNQAAQKLRAVIVARLVQWWEEAEGTVPVGDLIDEKVAAIQTLLVNTQIAMFTAVAEGLRVIDGELAIAALEAVDDSAGKNAIVAETRALVVAIGRGMQLGAYLESDGGAAGWLARHGGATD